MFVVFVAWRAANAKPARIDISLVRQHLLRHSLFDILRSSEAHFVFLGFKSQPSDFVFGHRRSLQLFNDFADIAFGRLVRGDHKRHAAGRLFQKLMLQE